MTAAALLSLAGVWVLAIAMPGPDTVQLIRLGSRSRRQAVVAALGICTGNVIWPIVSMIGLAALVAALPQLLAILFFGGGLFLAYMGLSAAKAGAASMKFMRETTHSGSASSSGDIPLLSDAAAWRLGLATNLANPKALIFFAAIFAQFIPVDATLVDRLLVLVLMTVIGVLWFCGFAWFVSMPLWASRLQKANPYIELGAGIIFVLLGAALVYEGFSYISH